jgi:hypothetical protein
MCALRMCSFSLRNIAAAARAMKRAPRVTKLRMPPII